MLKATILTHSLETSLADQFKGSAPTLLIANTLRRLGQGLKVCCEIVMEAVDAGLIPEGEEVVAVGGTARGWDTVAIVKSAASKRFMQLSVLEIRGKPRCEAGNSGAGRRARPSGRGGRWGIEPGDLDTIPAGFFGPVKGSVRGGDNLFGRGPVVRKDGYPERKAGACRKRSWYFTWRACTAWRRCSARSRVASNEPPGMTSKNSSPPYRQAMSSV